MEEKTNFLSAIAQIAEEKGISIESVLESKRIIKNIIQYTQLRWLEY